MWEDPIVEETRKVRDQIASQFNYDIKLLGEYFKKEQKLSKRATVSRPPKRISDTDASDPKSA